MRDIAYVALGSNLGDRARFLALGRDGIAALPRTRVLGATDVEETEPFGVPGQPRYLNQMIAVETSLSPRELLASLMDIEQRAGRVRGERWGPRTLDLDIVRFEHQSVAEPDLQVPHPGLPDREFWRRQLVSLAHLLAIQS